MTLDNQRLLQYSLYGLGLVLWFVIWKFLGSVTSMILVLGHMPQIDVPIFGSFSNLFALLALVIVVVVVEYTRRNEAANRFGIEVLGELKKVTWPNWKDVRGTTMVVLAVTFVVAFILFVFDKIYDLLIQGLFRLA